MTYKKNPLLLIDAYKIGHHLMYPKGTQMVYSNFTPRSVKRMPEMAKNIVVFGMQYMVKYIHDIFQENFFNLQKEEFLTKIKEYYSNYIGEDYNINHFEVLYNLGYLPIEIKALEEGTIIDKKIPVFTIKNTLPEFYWVTNFLETLMSSLLWKPMHSASIAYGFRKILQKYALETDKDNLSFIDFQGHDFSFRGMQHPESAITSGMGWLTCFKGSDTVIASDAIEYYYGTKNNAFSVNATEHSIACSYGSKNEIDYFERMIELFPNGILSLVSDSYDLWAVLTDFMPKLKDKIMARNGKIVLRPDSCPQGQGPEDIICGTHLIDNITCILPQERGVVQLLWDTFGGTINEQGYKVLDSHIGCIYGDSITLERAEEICQRLERKGFASTNVVLGIGSYSLSYATRDSQGCAMKATSCIVNGEFREIFKDPITDNGEKKSSKGLLMVYEENGIIKLKDQCTIEEENSGLLQTIYKDGKIVKEITFDQIKERILKTIIN